jgi:hypothetical protein
LERCWSFEFLWLSFQLCFVLFSQFRINKKFF